ncbi:MAG: cell division protein FtsW [Ilumatobacter sp.]|nr:MAG: cell division protein FtsW [Ilumatobacter sp.]
MTMTLAERRQATLERLELAGPPTPTGTSRPPRGIGARRRTQQFTGPPPIAYYVIAVVVAVFVMLGLVMVLSASAANEVGQGNSPYRIFGRQVMWGALGFVGLFMGLKIPYERWRPLVLPIAVLATGAMLLPFVPGLGVNINDTRAWIHLGSVSFQPSEVLKLAALALAADLLTRRESEVNDLRRGMLPLMAIAGIGASLCLVQGDLGSSVVLGAIILSVGFIAGVPLVFMSSIVVAGTGFIGLFVFSSPRRINRFSAFLDVAGNKDYLSYQTHQGFLSMANGGLTGSGIGGSNGKLGYLPLAHSDFIFAVIADELGFIGSVAVVGGFALFVYFGIQVALAAPDRFGMLLAGGIATWFGVQAIVNLGGVSGLMPVTGLTLPFFSAGGTSLFVMMAASGILLNVARRAR